MWLTLYRVCDTITLNKNRKRGNTVRAISIRNPFAHDIMCGLKDYEFRTWKTDYRGDLLICSSANPKIKGTICGHALCIVRLDDIIKITSKNYKEFGFDSKPEVTVYAWHLTDVRMIKPFPVKGKLNFYDVDDSLIEIIDNGDDSMTDEEAERLYKKYIEPLLYKGK